MDTAPPARKSDLGVRTLSATVMLAVAGGALWLGGWWWTAFVALVAFGVLWEWSRLAVPIASTSVGLVALLVLGFAYVIPAALVLDFARNAPSLAHKGAIMVLGLIAPVIATDIGAYFVGRAFGGPKIAPAISPSKTWSGLGGGIFGASAVIYFFFGAYRLDVSAPMIESLAIGALIAIVAQAGDFFESWMKRRAGVKDSGKLIPGHGGLFDRVDGLLAVCFVLGVIFMVSRLWSTL